MDQNRSQEIRVKCVLITQLNHQPLQIPPIEALAVARSQPAQRVGSDESLEIGDLLRATDQESAQAKLVTVLRGRILGRKGAP